LVNLTVRSTTQPAGVPVTLLPSGFHGTFTGSVHTVTATTPNRLRIAHSDTITADYFDASAGETRTATARADLVPPVIFGVGTSNAFGKTIVVWNTDENATAIVRYGTNSSLNFAATNTFLTDTHALTLNDLVPGRTYFFAVVSADEAGNAATNNNGGALFSFVAPSAPTVLLVNNYQNDDFGAGPDIPLTVYTDALDATGVTYEVWDMIEGAPSPTFDDLRPYRVVIWRVSDNVFLNNTLSAPEQSAIGQYVAGGGAFMMSSMEQLTRLPSGFKSNVLQVVSFGEDVTVPSAEGVAGNVVTGSEVSLPLDYVNYQTESYVLFGVPDDISDTMNLTTNAFPILTDSFGDVVGVAYPKPGLNLPGRVVFLSFPFDAISADDPAPNNRAAVMQRILNFLAPGQEGIGSITLNNTDFTLPSLAVIEVGDSDLAGAGQVSVTVASSTEPGGRSLTLSEFGRFGVFRGRIALVASHGANPAGELRAANGDTISATYFDASRSVSVTFTARVETVPPVISGRVIEPGYVDAFVIWNTDEPCDSLVQFGESPFLGRTAYVPSLSTSHEVFLDGLKPDHLYYYRIVSRDNAGNTTVDDNGGALYTFRTLTPFTAPWFDDLESGGGNWFVYEIEDSELHWQYGVPNNGVTAHSGSHVWASNLDGALGSFVESYLISPPIYLTGGNRATLRFWQHFDFTTEEDDLLHLGEVAIITNTSAQPITLDVIEEYASGDWEEAEYDLTPYSGQLVYLVWHYIYFSFGSAPRQGWLIDDISVTTSNVIAGTLRVTNNLSQASFAITGPLNISGQGNWFETTNAPPGTYTVTWLTNAHYGTPSPQTDNVVALGATLFSGTYTITDTNGNGMADSWERDYFGNASAGRTGFTDTDLDRMTDYAEFIAGTNPTNSASHLRFFTPAVQNTGAVRFEWPTVPGRSYRVTASGDLSTWAVATDWQRANGAVLSFTTNLSGGTKFYRVEVRP
jgi:hypothetical protein